MAFKELDKRNVSEYENSILESWGGINKITAKQIELRKDSENFVFYDGPATANGMPGVHHILAKLLKDTFCKYKTMKGYKVLRKVGWDTHGLPVEVQVEKELGFSGKKIKLILEDVYNMIDDDRLENDEDAIIEYVSSKHRK